jgi:hypothetical protein
MSTETKQSTRTATGAAGWKAGVLGGIAGALAMGVLVLVMNDATLAVAIPSLYGLAPPPNPGLGIAVHVSHGAVLGVVFAGLTQALDVRETNRLVGLGIAWGVAAWIGLAALVMPLWLAAVGSPASPPFPNFAPPSLLWHVVYGLVLGVVVVALRDRV